MIPLGLSGRTALVTGATGQLGRAIVRVLGACGADVAVHYHRNRTKADELVAELGASGVRASSFQADVTREEDVRRMRDEIADGLAAPDIVVINAVIPYAWKAILDQPAADFEGQFRSSVLHAVLVAKAFLPAMITRRRGRIIAIGSDLAIRALPDQGAYVAGKRGLDGVMRVLAREVGPHGVTVNQVFPGWMISDNQREAGTTEQSAYAAHIPLGRRGEDTDVATAVAFLASDLAGYITGSILPVCGGYAMPMV